VEEAVMKTAGKRREERRGEEWVRKRERERESVVASPLDTEVSEARKR
jgi:hypothetical protein